MNGSLQSRIAPTVSPNSADLSGASVKSTANMPALDSTGKTNQIDFRTLVGNSNADAINAREAKGNKDLSKAKNDQEFFDMLSEQTKEKRVPKNTLGKDDFMKLFIAQIQNQDPLQPKDSSEMASQLAQFNSLEQMLNVNTSLEKLLEANTTNRAVSMIDYVGKEVTVEGGSVKLSKGKINDTKFMVDQSVGKSNLEIRNSSGEVVMQRELGVLNPGEHKLEWDGKTSSGKDAPDGIYTFAVLAQGIEGEEIPVRVTSRLKVAGVDLQKGGSLFTELGPVDISRVAAVGSPGFIDDKKAASPVQKQAPSDVSSGQPPLQELAVPPQNPASEIPPDILKAALQKTAAQLQPQASGANQKPPSGDDSKARDIL